MEYISLEEIQDLELGLGFQAHKIDAELRKLREISSARNWVEVARFYYVESPGSRKVAAKDQYQTAVLLACGWTLHKRPAEDTPSRSEVSLDENPPDDEPESDPTPAIVLLNEQHSLLPAQVSALNELGRPWEILPVPATGWTADEIRAQTEELRECALVIFASPVPLLIKLVAEQGTSCKVFHNDHRIAKEVPDGKGGVRVIHVVAPEGWELL